MNHGIPQFKMLGPCLVTGVEESDKISGEWVEASQVWAFVEVAAMACQSQILQIIRAMVLARDNVLNVERN